VTSFVVLIVAEDFVTMSGSKATCMALGHFQTWLPEQYHNRRHACGVIFLKGVILKTNNGLFLTEKPNLETPACSKATPSHRFEVLL
jgi:hypothetical protein